MKTSAGSVTTAPGTFEAAEPVSVLAPVEVELTVALFVRPVVVAVTASPTLPPTQVFLSVRLRLTRVFVYVQTTSASGIVKVAPGALPDGVAPVHATVVV